MKRFPSAADIDTVVADRPVMLGRVDGHALVANSAAMRVAGVTAQTAVPSGGQIDNGLFVLQRNPLAVAFGAQSRERYIERVNPSYAALIKLMDGLPAQAHIYSLLEPRSYRLPRTTQADPLNSNFSHDAYLYNTPSEIIEHWKAEQCTYVLVYERGLNVASGSSKFPPDIQRLLKETLDQLQLVDQTPDSIYSLYKIP